MDLFALWLVSTSRSDSDREMSWLADTQAHKVIIGILALDHLWDRITQLWNHFHDTEAFVVRQIGERRHTMPLITEGEALIKLIPAVEKAISDARAASQDAAVLQVISDLEIIVNDVKTGLETPAPSTPPAAA
jgi:hypothetical protein